MRVISCHAQAALFAVCFVASPFGSGLMLMLGLSQMEWSFLEVTLGWKRKVEGEMKWASNVSDPGGVKKLVLMIARRCSSGVVMGCGLPGGAEFLVLGVRMVREGQV
jgi:hypothetical protein